MIEVESTGGSKINWYALVALIAIGFCAGYPTGRYWPKAETPPEPVPVAVVEQAPQPVCPNFESDFKMPATLPAPKPQRQVVYRPAKPSVTEPPKPAQKSDDSRTRFQSYYEMLEKYETPNQDER